MVFKSICLSGGGITGFVHLGMLKYLEDKRLLTCFDTVVCTSAGAIIGFLFAVGLSADKIMNAALSIGDEVLQYESIHRFFSVFGMDSGEYLLAKLADILMENSVSPVLTFEEARSKYGKRLIITGTNVSRHSVTYFKPETHPNMRIIDAVRISISIPFLFSAVAYEQDIYVDGAIMDNYPVRHCISDFVARFPGYNPSFHVIGCHVESINAKRIKNIEDYIYGIFACCLMRGEERDEPCTVRVDVSQVSSMDFNADPSKRNVMLKMGYDATAAYFAQFSRRTTNLSSCSRERRFRSLSI